ncbi:NAD-dependent epimerase/dehydratase family protein [Cytophagaceae bacterium AH-315-L13]|nr:NAD-dependent epimerase/dehydratase family protein [Cytophagaceae bacterium AH-315-L13]
MHSVKDATIFLTGGAGFVGSYIIEQLIPSEPKKIIILDNMLRGTFYNMKSFIDNPIVEFIEGDIRDTDKVREIMSQSDYCFHLAALRINRCAADPKEAFDVMVKANFDVIEAAKDFKIKKFIYSSSASIYGLAQNFPTPETDNPYDNKTFYGAAKMFGEQLLRCYHDMYGLDYVALRYFNVYGPRMDTEGKYTEVMIKWLDCIRDNKDPLIFGDGSTSMDFVYVSDIARANILALTSDVTDEAFNVGNCRETSLHELLELLIKANESELKPKYMPDNTINPVSKRIASIDKAKELLGFEPEVSLEKGLKQLSDWYFERVKEKQNDPHSEAVSN